MDIIDFNLSSIYVRPDGSYVVNQGMYHVPNKGEWADLWKEVDAYAKAHPEVVKVEPTPEELAALEFEKLTPEEQEAVLLAEAKSERAAAVAALTVEVDGMVFDGDENAMRRMSNALTAAQSADVDNWRTVTVPWVLADNTVVTVTMEQLARALRGAMESMAKLWVLPYS